MAKHAKLYMDAELTTARILIETPGEAALVVGVSVDSESGVVRTAHSCEPHDEAAARTFAAALHHEADLIEDGACE
jgi:hypothetical protein